MANAIVELKKEGLSVVLSEQNIHFAELVSDRVYVLEKGQMQWQGRMADLGQGRCRAAQLPVGLKSPATGSGQPADAAPPAACGKPEIVVSG